MSALVLLLGAFLAPAPDEEQGPASLSDLPEYREALEADARGPAPLVTFRDLWDRPDFYRGRPVRVEGRVARLFRQEPLGAFPALTEAWASSPEGDPFCLVFPTGDGDSPQIGATVRFRGTFLRPIRYKGGDVDRLAPLIVGGGPPEMSTSPPRQGPASGFTPLDWGMGIAVSGVVVLILLRQFLGRPARRPAHREPPPTFYPPEETGGAASRREPDPPGDADHV
jgi:hypothetical protein